MARASAPSRTILVLAVVATILLIIASPLLTLWLSQADVNWQHLSSVGESFGVTATILSGAAMIGVVVTVNLQRRQGVMMAEQAARQLHLEIMREAWLEPRLLRSLEFVPSGQEEAAKNFAFLNIYFMYLRLGVNSEQVTLDEVEDLALHCFSTPTGADYWSRAAPHMRRHYESRFVRTLDRARQRSLARPEGLFIDDDTDPAGSG